MNETENQAALDAAKDAAQQALNKTAGRNLTQLERAAWILLAVLAAAAASFLTSCTSLTMTPAGTTATGEHGETVTITPGFFSYTQKSPEPSGDVIVQPSKK